MLDIDDLSRAIAAYWSGQLSLDQFADWFRAVSRRKFAESEEVRQAILEIDSLFSRLDFDGLSEAVFQQELTSVVRPFAPREARFVVVLAPQRVTLNLGDMIGPRPFVLGTDSPVKSSDLWGRRVLAAS